jgi:hypothetical protein
MVYCRLTTMRAEVGLWEVVDEKLKSAGTSLGLILACHTSSYSSLNTVSKQQIKHFWKCEFFTMISLSTPIVVEQWALLCFAKCACAEAHPADLYMQHSSPISEQTHNQCKWRYTFTDSCNALPSVCQLKLTCVSCNHWARPL